MDPLTKGDYPKSMRDTAGKALPTFTEEQQKLIMGSLDFVAINYYFPYVTTAGTVSPSAPPTFDTRDQAINDVMRQQYLHDHANAVGEAIRVGCGVRGYFIWSFQDNLE